MLKVVAEMKLPKLKARGEILVIHTNILRETGTLGDVRLSVSVLSIIYQKSEVHYVIIIIVMKI